MTDRRTYDVSSPMVIASVLDQNGNAELLSSDVAVILSMTYTDQERGADKLSLVVDNYDLQHLDNDIWKHGNRVRVQWGYAGRMSPARDCVIRKVSGFQQLTVEAHGLEVVMGRVTRSRTFEGLTRSAIARQVATENGYGDDAVDIDDTEEVLEHVVQGGISDAQFLARLAHGEGYQFYISHDGFHFHERRLELDACRSFTWFTDQERGEVLSINIESDLSARPGRVRAVGRDLSRRRNVSSTADNRRDTNRGTTGEHVASPDPESGRRSGQVLAAQQHTVPTSRSARGAATASRARFRESQQRAVKMTMTAVGDPLLNAKTVVDVEGIGQRYGGFWYIKEIAHNVSSSGYTMSMSLVKDATGAYSRRHRRSGQEVGLPEVAATRATGRRTRQRRGSSSSATTDQPQRHRDGEQLSPRTRTSPDSGRPRTEYARRGAGESRTQSGARPEPPAATRAAQAGEDTT